MGRGKKGGRNRQVLPGFREKRGNSRGAIEKEGGIFIVRGFLDTKNNE